MSILTASPQRLTSHAPAANTDAVATITPGAAETVLVHSITYSYSATPTGGALVTTGLVADELSVAVPAAGEKQMTFDPPLSGALGGVVTVTLATGTGTVVGKINVGYSIR